MITHLEPDILECEVKWALGSITMNKASGGDGIPAELFQILKDDAVNVLNKYASIFGKLSSGHRTGKIGDSNPKESKAKECSNYCTITFISHISKVMLNILQARLQQYVNHELPGVRAGFRKDRGIRYQITNICWLIEKARAFQKTTYFCFIGYAKAFDCVITTNCLKFFKRCKYQTTSPAS